MTVVSRLEALSLSEVIADFDAKEQLTRIDRSIAETRKFIAEHDKLAAESAKYYAEQAKLVAEAMKYNRDHRLSPWLAVAAISGGIGGTIAGAVAILKLAGILP